MAEGENGYSDFCWDNKGEENKRNRVDAIREEWQGKGKISVKS